MRHDRNTPSYQGVTAHPRVGVTAVALVAALTGLLVVASSTARGAAAGAGAAAAPVELTFAFTASSFGGGPNRRGSSPGAPLRSVRGTLTISYLAESLATAKLVSLRVRGVSGAARAARWGESFTPSVMRVELTRAGARPAGATRPILLRLDGVACGTRVCGGTNDLSLSFEFGPRGTSLRFRTARYALSGDREVYRARAGTVSLSSRS
jgi:hypothetical protein